MTKLSPVAQKFVLHWGEMGTRWGINRTVAQVHALLFLSEKPLPADEIAETLGVARSNIVGMRALGIDVTLVGPATLLPNDFAVPGVRVERDLDAVLARVDAVMMLRIQRERIESGLLPSLEDYTQRYQLNRARLRSLRGDAVILHPGPYNRGVELTDDVLDDPRSRYVAQVANGVFVRMAVLDLLVNGAPVPA